MSLLTHEASSIRQALNRAAGHLTTHHIESPRRSAELLLSHLLHLSLSDMHTHADRLLSSAEYARFTDTVCRRSLGEPVAYITGTQAFWEFEFAVNPHVLIPRPDTEKMVETALLLLKRRANTPYSPSLRVWEPGVGSGAVILTLASLFPHGCYTAWDISRSAVQVAGENAACLGVANRVNFFVSDWFSAISRHAATKADLIVVNPPYIRRDIIPGLAPEVAVYEPKTALDGGMDGLWHIRNIVSNAGYYLNKNGHLLMEIGYDQKEAVCRLFVEAALYTDIKCIKDDAGHDRVISVRRG